MNVGPTNRQLLEEINRKLDDIELDRRLSERHKSKMGRERREIDRKMVNELLENEARFEAIEKLIKDTKHNLLDMQIDMIERSING